MITPTTAVAIPAIRSTSQIEKWKPVQPGYRPTAAARSAELSHTPKTAISASTTASQIAVFTARRVAEGSASQRSCGRPTAPRAVHHAREIDWRRRRFTSSAFRRPLAEQPFGPEDEDQDEDREDDRLRPVAAGRVPAEPVVVCLDEADRERA